MWPYVFGRKWALTQDPSLVSEDTTLSSETQLEDSAGCLLSDQAIIRTQQQYEALYLANLIFLGLLSTSHHIENRSRQNANYNWVTIVPS